ncbi:MAG: DEAD/DEAH box helicase [Tateyamaria sp.]|nr:DEAD/DEAH box helicase [Tateyamaria sp.]
MIPLQTALTARGFTELTPVQTAVTNTALVDSDMLVSAQTGSGKTVGFGLALGPTLLGNRDRFAAASAPLALIIAPTRELAIQVKRELAWLYAETGVVMASCVGGMDMRDERRALTRGAHIVVATPGRLRDHIMRGSIDLSTIRGVVLDEADEMLDLGFREDLEFILGKCPEERRTLMFSATVPAQIARLAKTYQKNAVRLAVESGGSQHADITYQAMFVANHDAENAIINLLRFHEAPNAIVFCNTRAMVNRVTTRLSNRGFLVVALSGELTQSERTNALQAMRDGRARVCVATDVAARGIDLPNLELVINAELPSNHETLLHRSGRTGRAGRKGISALIITSKVRSKAIRILKSAKLDAEWIEAPSADAIRAQDEVRLLADPMWTDAVTEGEVDIIASLTNKFDATQLAAAILRTYNLRHSAPEHLSAVTSEKTHKERAPFGPSVWFSINGGRNQGVEVRRLLPIVCNAGNITKDDIGAIRIQDDITYIEIQESTAKGFISALGKDRKIEGSFVITRLKEAPEVSNLPKPRFESKSNRKSVSNSPKNSRGNRPKANSNDKDTPAIASSKRVWKTNSSETKDTKPAGPIDWDDAPAPRIKKPKISSKIIPKTKGKSRFSKGPSTLEKAVKDGIVSELKKPRHKTNKNSAHSNAAPKVGKPNSKKNKARRAAASEGSQPPRRKV